MKVVILGGGFCGAWIAKKLDKNKDLEVVLTDKKDYFEYTPSLWKLLTNASYHKRIIIQHTKYLKRTRVVTDPVVQVTPTHLKTEREKIPFDYLVISTGIDYPIFLKNTTNVFTVKSGIEILKYNKQVTRAKTVLIIGGGVIGTEVAGALSTNTARKKIILVHPYDRLLERNNPSVSRYAKKFLEEHGVDIIFGEKIVEYEKGVFITDKNRRINADLGIWCAGIKWNPWFMKEFPASIFTEKKALKVNSFLQLEGYPHIFVGGDINDVNEEKTAAAADRQAITIIANISRRIAGKKLYRYTPIMMPMDISLGLYDGIIIYPPFMIPGMVPALVKFLVEKIALKRL